MRIALHCIAHLPRNPKATQAAVIHPRMQLCSASRSPPAVQQQQQLKYPWYWPSPARGVDRGGCCPHQARYLLTLNFLLSYSLPTISWQTVCRSPPCRDQLVNIVEMERKLEAQAQDGRRQWDDFPVLKSTRMVKAETACWNWTEPGVFSDEQTRVNVNFYFGRPTNWFIVRTRYRDDFPVLKWRKLFSEKLECGSWGKAACWN